MSHTEAVPFDAGRVLYEDASCVVINKLPGEALEADSGGEQVAEAKSLVSLPHIVAAHLGVEKLHVVHRLDVPVSGCVVLAKDSDTLAFLNTAFARGRVRKLYWAIVEASEALDTFVGALPQPDEGPSLVSGELIHFISVDARYNKSHAHRENGPGRYEARLRWRLAGRGDNYAFLEIDLLTGRHHQIRAQLAAEGLHIKGDLKYGSRRSERAGGIRLHSRMLSFPNPAQEAISITVLADPPRPDPLWKACMDACST